MPLHELRVSSYRSLRDLTMPVERLAVFVGANGTGKSNLYRALMLLAAAAGGRLANVLAEEGGMPSALWAGARRKDGPARITLGVSLDRYAYDIELGIPGRTEPALPLDPMIRRERVQLIDERIVGPVRKVTLLERDGPSIWVRDAKGRRVAYQYELLASETALAGIRDPVAFPELAVLQQELSAWRFYQHFRTDAQSPIRAPQLGICTPVLGSDGHDLAAALKTAITLGDRHDIDAAVADAFPGATLDIADERSRYAIGLQMPGIFRPFAAPELSDGTLRYLCLVGALLSYRLPSFLALNEPESSLHPDLLAPLARLIAAASRRTQVWVVTHSDALARHLRETASCTPRRVTLADGATAIEGLNLLGRFADAPED
ncbi:MAG: AAA family ATPase [Alphaproteobacteria bacterium]|nr:AAA family ATPase [Alphaproteobacteria bacterium]